MDRFVFSLILLLPAFLSGQSGSVPFSHISTAEGLSQGQVNHILKTSDGFLWIATQDGLNRYDGYEFRAFYHQPGDTNSLPNNFIWTLFEDSKEGLWGGGLGGGLCRYDRKTETFQVFYPEGESPVAVAENSIRSFCEFPAGKLCVGTEKGLWSFDLDTERYFPMPLPIECTSITGLRPISKNRILIGASQGLFCFNLETGWIQTVRFEGMEIQGVTAFADVGDELWVGGIPGLIKLRFCPETDTVVVTGRLLPKREMLNERLANAVTALHLDEFGQLWVGSLDGLHRIDTRKPGAGFYHYHYSPDQKDGLSDNQINCLLEVEPGLLWAGTRQGINRWTGRPPVFRTISRSSSKRFCSEVVLGMAQDESGMIWLGTKEGLVSLPSLENPESARCYSPQATPGMGAPYVINVKFEDGGIWATFWRGGAGKLRNDGLGFEGIPGLDELTNGAGIHDLLAGRDGKVWLATPNRGLVCWDTQDGKLTSFMPDPGNQDAISSPYVFHLAVGRQGHIWVATANGGLCRFNPDTGGFRCFLNDSGDSSSISSNMVLSTFEDSQGRFWVCTAKGLNLLRSDGRFQRFGQKQKMPDGVVYGMLEDNEGALWVSTNHGLCKIRYEKNVITVQNFNTNQGGLQGNEFNQYSFLKLADGTLCFGGTGGLTFFDPAQTSPYPHAPTIAFTDFQLFNQSVSPGKGILEKSINETEEIFLRHDQNYIAVEFAALGYTQTENNRYAFQLEGLDKDWTPFGSRRFASYPNLPPGEYLFQVRATNHDGIWSEDAVRSLKITVMKPWWATWWAFLIYGIGAATAVIVFIRQREVSVRLIERAKADERELFRKRIARDFHDEAGNQITRLALLTEVARRQPGADLGLIAQIEENIQALRSGMRDFIWVLDPENDTLYNTLLRLKDFAGSLFEHSSIRFNMEKPDESLHKIPLSGNERRHVLLIFKEALNNCIKHSAAQNAFFFARHDELSFSDNGKGFVSDAMPGRGLANMKARAEKIGAVLIIEASPGRGTTISLRLKTTQMGDKT
jgi:ligand-binding sensor domain-containing protein/signal transduction histidine kinase